jgi:dTDP-L-rhamnose 4-epimerase
VKVLVTGGAGFIGSHLVDALLADGCEVRILDSLVAQVHGPERKRPDYLTRDAELQVGDICDPCAVAKALDGVEVVFHEAAAVGVGQSMYEIARYVSVNSLGAATLLEGIVERRDRIRKIIVASSMSIYGEGAYRTQAGETVYPKPRAAPQLEAHRWEMADADGSPLLPVATAETKPAAPASVYAVTKRDHEELFLVTGAAYGIDAVALRYFNAYGPRQALSNPYTGLLAIICSQLMHRVRPVIFEDGQQIRDFVHVSDLVRANLLALRGDQAAGKVFNVGSGRPIRVLDVVDVLSRRFNFADAPELVRRYRPGDIRHCFADVSLISTELGYRPIVTLEDGADELIRWIETRQSTVPPVPRSRILNIGPVHIGTT